MVNSGCLTGVMTDQAKQACTSDRIRRINQSVASMASRQGGTYIDLQSTFSDRHSLLKQDLTTDGLHLSGRGYNVWQTALVNL
jgi:lysophospholipase L1-like esterase